MKHITKEERKELENRYLGKRIRLIKMDDIQAPPPGTMGTVRGIQDDGSLDIVWDTGSSLNIYPGEDKFEIAGLFLVTVIKDKYYSECGVEVAGLFSSLERAELAKKEVERLLDEEEYDDSEVFISEPTLNTLDWYETKLEL